MMTLADIRKQIAATTEALAKADTELKWELAASAADVAGMVDPTPASDLIGAGLAIRKGDWLGAGMSVASMVPYVGDALAKPAKAVRATKNINALRETLTKLTAKLADLKKAEKQAEAASNEAKIAKDAIDGSAGSSAKQTAKGQKDAAGNGKNNDCEDCGNGSGARNNGKSGRLPETKVSCFHPFDKKKFMRLSAEDRKEYLKDMSKQLSGQQDALNSLTANEFKAARDAYNSQGRNPVAAASQDDLRNEIIERMKPSIRRSLQAQGMSAREAIAQAKVRTEEIMDKLAALHEPDMVAGGWTSPAPTKMGRSDINSSIGGSWRQQGRIAALDDAAQKAIDSGQGDQKMNAKLELCRGKGLK